MTQPRPDKQSAWAVVNLEADPDNFKFEVALGGTMEWGPEPESLVMHPDAKTVDCHVWMLPSKSVPKSVRKLEVVAPTEGGDVTEVTWLCQQQLALGLWLFKPVFFWITP